MNRVWAEEMRRVEEEAEEEQQRLKDRIEELDSVVLNVADSILNPKDKSHPMTAIEIADAGVQLMFSFFYNGWRVQYVVDPITQLAAVDGGGRKACERMLEFAQKYAEYMVGRIEIDHAEARETMQTLNEYGSDDEEDVEFAPFWCEGYIKDLLFPLEKAMISAILVPNWMSLVYASGGEKWALGGFVNNINDVNRTLDAFFDQPLNLLNETVKVLRACNKRRVACAVGTKIGERWSDLPPEMVEMIKDAMCSEADLKEALAGVERSISAAEQSM